MTTRPLYKITNYLDGSQNVKPVGSSNTDDLVFTEGTIVPPLDANKEIDIHKPIALPNGLWPVVTHGRFCTLPSQGVRNDFIANEQVVVAWSKGAPVFIMGHRWRKSSSQSVASPAGGGIVEELFIGYTGLGFDTDIWFRNDKVVGSLGIVKNLLAPRYGTLGTDWNIEDVQWGTRTDSILVTVTTFIRLPFYVVILLKRVQNLRVSAVPIATIHHIVDPETCTAAFTWNFTYSRTLTAPYIIWTNPSGDPATGIWTSTDLRDETSANRTYLGTLASQNCDGGGTISGSISQPWLDDALNVWVNGYISFNGYPLGKGVTPTTGTFQRVDVSGNPVAQTVLHIAEGKKFTDIASFVVNLDTNIIAWTDQPNSLSFTRTETGQLPSVVYIVPTGGPPGATHPPPVPDTTYDETGNFSIGTESYLGAAGMHVTPVVGRTIADITSVVQNRHTAFTVIAQSGTTHVSFTPLAGPRGPFVSESVGVAGPDSGDWCVFNPGGPRQEWARMMALPVLTVSIATYIVSPPLKFTHVGDGVRADATYMHIEADDVGADIITRYVRNAPEMMEFRNTDLVTDMIWRPNYDRPDYETHIFVSIGAVLPPASTTYAGSPIGYDVINDVAALGGIGIGGSGARAKRTRTVTTTATPAKSPLIDGQTITISPPIWATHQHGPFYLLNVSEDGTTPLKIHAKLWTPLLNKTPLELVSRQDEFKLAGFPPYFRVISADRQHILFYYQYFENESSFGPTTIIYLVNMVNLLNVSLRIVAWFKDDNFDDFLFYGGWLDTYILGPADESYFDGFNPWMNFTDPKTTGFWKGWDNSRNTTLPIKTGPDPAEPALPAPDPTPNTFSPVPAAFRAPVGEKRLLPLGALKTIPANLNVEFFTQRKLHAIDDTANLTHFGLTLPKSS